DGWSIAVFLSDLVALYEGHTTGKGTALLPPLPVQYADFAHWQRSLLQGAWRDELLGYWRERLAGSPQTLEPPADRPRPPVQSFRGRHLRFALPQDLASRAKRLGDRRGATLF